MTEQAVRNWQLWGWEWFDRADRFFTLHDGRRLWLRDDVAIGWDDARGVVLEGYGERMILNRTAWLTYQAL